MKRKLSGCAVLFWWLALFNSVNSHAQLPEKNLYFRHITKEQGLSNGLIKDILKDKDGFLWIATLNGLNCYDGSHFKVWKTNTDNESSLLYNFIHAICEDDSSNIWCATDAGISRFSKTTNTFRNYGLINSQTGKEELHTINAIIISRTGKLITQSYNGIYIYNNKKDKFIHYPFEPVVTHNKYLVVSKNSFIEDPDYNGIWMGTNKGLHYFDLEKLSYTDQPPHKNYKLPVHDHYISAIAFDNQKQLLYTDETTEELYTHNFKTGKTDSSNFAKLNGNHGTISGIFVDDLNNKWLSNFGYTPLYQDGKTGEFYSFNHEASNPNSLASDFFWEVFQDLDGTLYFGTIDGISYTNLHRQDFTIIKLPDSLNHSTDYYASIFLGTKNDDVYLTVGYSHIFSFNIKSMSWTDHGVYTKNNKIIYICAAVFTDSINYYGTNDGIYINKPGEKTLEPLRSNNPKLPLEGSYIKILKLYSGKLWFAIDKNGVGFYDFSEKEFHYFNNDSTNPNSITNELIFDIFEDKKGEIWLGSINHGLIKYDKSRMNFQYIFKNNPDYYRGATHSLQSDNENNIWFQNTIQGLVKYNPVTGETDRNFAGNLLSNVTYGSLLIDGDNVIMSRYTEYSQLNLKTNEAYNYEINYSRHNYRYVNKIIKIKNGIYLSEINNGFIIINKKNAGYKVREPLLVSGFRSAKYYVPFQCNQINLEYKQNYFTIDFSTLSLLNNPDLQFRYMLEGFDEGWIDSDGNRSATYTNLNGGDYQFRVKYKNSEGVWIENILPVHIHIASIFYRTLWFKSLLILLLIASLIWYARLWRKKELKKDADKAIAYFANSAPGKNKVEEILWDLTQNVISRTNFVDCVIYLIDEKRNVLVQKAAYGAKNPEEYKISNPLEIPVGTGIVGSIAASGKAEIINNTHADPRYITDDESRQSEMCVPILYENKVIGIIDSEHPGKNFFTEEHLEMMKTIASICGTKIMNAQQELEIEQKENRLKELQLQMSHTRQQALRAQMNPHFIFNCLNSINGFILKNDATTASAYLITFSKLIRLILENSNERTISLSNELDALKLYIEMELLRFDKKFNYSVTIADDIIPDLILVPPLILQPFIENSIWHGLLHKEESGNIRLFISKENTILKCIIEDDGVGREMSAALKTGSIIHKRSLGMKLTNERLALMNEEKNKTSLLQITDITDNNGKVTGTRVTITLETIIDD